MSIKGNGEIEDAAYDVVTRFIHDKYRDYIQEFCLENDIDNPRDFANVFMEKKNSNERIHSVLYAPGDNRTFKDLYEIAEESANYVINEFCIGRNPLKLMEEMKYHRKDWTGMLDEIPESLEGLIIELFRYEFFEDLWGMWYIGYELFEWAFDRL